MIKGWYRGILTIITTLVLFLTQVGGNLALAAGVTPFGPERFAHASATYVITTKSPYYRRIWQSAISAWNKTGAFHFKAGTKGNAQIDLETASKSQAASLGDDVGLTEYTAQNDYLTKVKATLNPTLLHAYDYSRSDDLHVAEHELGHTMGLAHNPSKHSVMYYRNRTVGIQKVDIEGVQLRYHTPAGQSAK
ncbi:MAG: matrixin family metalloprotease [Levilactobacillus sp.]|jgi:predicted Zn-dependent protease|uniref:Zn-dependent protease n=1 Tax=Levilactobacillus suantsaiihabitans TaxID=2487722 RepID=A0A4Z0JCP1_9LACO|nr:MULTISPECIES: matrixin family metalloprotease [Levilactobacillus]MCH4123336.1 matrixin family metalloprotease [Levilactobacillus sp.]MCI1552526.1 matrixin family metalloprotease [Levilactobacillus sp.]MCI1606196.1 matrixin family metalloprotease [Levilactobacillus sp.]TGD18977.1 Zn-dependent protease [Levilactobacillus suantsaiihabitans]